MASIWDTLLTSTVHDAHAWTLPNIRGEGRERWVGSRSVDRLERFAAKNDREGFGQFFCVSTIQHGQPRKKEFARELVYVFVDVDCKDIELSQEEIEHVLVNLTLVPSRIHATGNGYHVFWKLDVPAQLPQDLERVEALLKRLANHVGGDLTVAHAVALLRTPGTHNSKRGEWRPVRVITEGAQAYSLDQIDAWVGTGRDPVLVRRGRETNPFLRVAGEQAFRAPVDVEQRLAAMEVEGEGDRGVHATHLSCSASMVHAGMDEDEIVEVIMAATQALPGAGAWDWGQEERTLRAMCRDFEKKLDKRPKPKDITGAIQELVSSTNSPQPENVVSLSQARAHKDKGKERPVRDEPPRLKKQKNEHVVIGMGILAQLAEDGRQIMYAGNQCWMYDGGIWTGMTETDERAWACVMVERGCNAIGLVSTTKIVNETRAWLQRQPDLHRKNIEWDGHGLIATLDGTVDWEDGSVEPLEPDDYATRRVECRYDPAAACPTWLNMLTTDYHFDAGTISFLQEFAGTCLISKKPRGLMRALVLLGPSNTGKSNILNVLAGLISKEFNTTPLQTLENSHGLMSFLRPNPWVLHEAFEQSRWEMSASAKALLSGDTVQVNVKNGPLVPVNFVQPILWGSNVPPQFREASRAMENRLAIVNMHRAFNPMQVVGTASTAQEQGFRNPAELVLDTERAGLLNWAIEGLKRAMARGYFDFTEQMQASLHDMRSDSNMATGFIEECAAYDPATYISTADFYGAFRTWWTDYRGGQLPSADSLGRAMSSLSDPRVLTGHRINKKRIYAGLKLNDEGLDCWNGFSSSTRAAETGQRLSASDAEVNKVLGPEQLQFAHFVEMQTAHRTWQPE